jgi:UDP-glucose 4-epimerase
MTNAHHPIKDRTFLITGGASLIGSHIADRLLADGAREVRLFDNFSLGKRRFIR